MPIKLIKSFIRIRKEVYKRNHLPLLRKEVF
jgi:hypothetical protein